jgi:hypothetical protein
MANEQQRDWDRHDWSGEEHPADEKQAKRWDDKEWAGEKPDDAGSEHGAGDSGLTGGGHAPGEQHWVPDKE